MKPPREDLSGQQFGYLKVLKMIPVSVRAVNYKVWGVLCECVCKNKEYITGNISALRAGKITSCGCSPGKSQRLRGSRSTTFAGYKEIPGKTWTDIVHRATRRDYVVDLSIEDAWNLFEQQKRRCALSGLPIMFGRTDYPRETTASLDRIDSSGEYKKGNVQWVHKVVNIMKNVFDQEYFVNFCKRIANNMVATSSLTDEQMFERYMSKDYIEKCDEQVRERSARQSRKKKLSKEVQND